MKRGFEENVPRVRPRVRLGRAFDETGAEIEGAAQDDTPDTAPQLELAASPEAQRGGELAIPEPSPEAPQPAAAQMRPSTAPPEEVAESRPPGPVEAAVQPIARASYDGIASRPGPRRSPAAAQVAQLAKDLTTEVAHAAAANAQLRADLDGAVTALRRAAEEARDQRAETDHLAAELQKRGSLAEQLRREMELLEAERDGALGQVARLARELREERTRAAGAVRDADAARAEAAQAREHAQRLAAEAQARAAERDQARKAAEALTAERDALEEALVAARAEADEALQSRTALEEIHRALDEARSRVARLR
jgi:hypothetical protein